MHFDSRDDDIQVIRLNSEMVNVSNITGIALEDLDKRIVSEIDVVAEQVPILDEFKSLFQPEPLEVETGGCFEQR